MQVTSKDIFNRLGRTIKFILYAINGSILLLLLCSFLSWHISPERYTFFAYAGFAFPLILFVNVAFLIFWIIRLNWKLVLSNITILLVCYSPISAYFPVNFGSKDVPENSIKFLTYNVRAFNWEMDKKWTKDHPMVEYIRSVDADIVCMQEYMTSVNERLASTKNLQKALEIYPYYSVIPLWPLGKGYEYGLACFSKYPIKSILKIPVDSDSNGSALYNIDVNGKIITVVNNHLESNRLTSEDKKLYKDFLKEKENGPGLNEVTQNIEERLGTAYKKRAPQVDMIAHYIAEQKTDGVIICGDFNDTPISYTYQKMRQNMFDAYVETGFGPGITFHENLFWFRIDYIMHSKNMEAYNFTIDKVKYSDHYPVWTYLHFK